MGVVRIDALCACDGCEKRFGVELDVAENIKDGHYDDFENLVHETVRNGNATVFTWGIRGKLTVDRLPLSYQATIQAGLLLCDVCSKRCDEFPIEGNLNRAQVNQALGIPQSEA